MTTTRPTGGPRPPSPPIGASLTPRVGPVDGWLLGTVLMLLFIGTLFVFDSSYVRALQNSYTHNDPLFYLKKQVQWVAIGLVAFVIGMKMGYWRLRRVAPTILLVSVVLLVLVLLIGKTVWGAKRWISLGPLGGFQPSEVSKLALMLFLADYVVRYRKSMRDLKEGFLPVIVPIGIVCGLVVIEPDMGTTLATVGVAICILYLGGASPRHLAGFVGVGVLAVIALCIIEPYRLERLLVYLDPWRDPGDTGYQVLQGLSALGSGGLVGLGLGQGRAKWLYLPAEHTDFIFAIIGEEWGFLGGLGILGLFLFLVRRGFLIAAKCGNRFGRMLAMGISITIGLQAMMNIGVVCTVLPATGVPLPLISFGGSSLVLTLFALGVLTDISRRPALPWDNEENDSRIDRRWNRGPHLSGPGDRGGAGKARRVRPVHR